MSLSDKVRSLGLQRLKEKQEGHQQRTFVVTPRPEERSLATDFKPKYNPLHGVCMETSHALIVWANDVRNKGTSRPCEVFYVMKVLTWKFLNNLLNSRSQVEGDVRVSLYYHCGLSFI